MSGMLTQIASFLSSWIGATVFCLVILLFGTERLIRLEQARSQVATSLNEAKRRLQQFSSNEFIYSFSEFDDWIRADRVLGEPWREYSRHVFPVADGTNSRLVSLSASSLYFSESTTLGRHINLHWFSSVPNVLTGLGLLGTFVGLVAGIWLAQGGLASSRTEEMVSSLKSLLGGAATAFWTSIVGLCFSICFLWRFRTTRHALHSLLRSFLSALDEKIEQLPHEKLNYEAVRHLANQADAFRQFSDTLQWSLPAALEERLSPKLTDAVDRLIAAIEGIRQDRNTADEEMLNRLVGQFQNALSGAAGRELEGMATTLQRLNANLQAVGEALGTGRREWETGIQNVFDTLRQGVAELGQKLTEHQAEMQRVREEELSSVHTAHQRQLEELLNRIEAHTQRLTEEFTAAGLRIQEQLSEGVQTLVGQLKSARFGVQETLTQSGNAILSGTKSLENTFFQLATSVTDVVREVSQGQHTVRETVRALADLHAGIRASANELEQSHRHLNGLSSTLARTAEHLMSVGRELSQAIPVVRQATEQLSTASAGLAQHSDLVRQVWEQQRERFEKLDQELQRAFDAFHRGVNQYLDKVKQFSEDLDQLFGNAIQDLAGAINELHQTVEDLHVSIGELDRRRVQ